MTLLSPTAPALRIEGLECRFGAVLAVGGVTLDVAPGERHAGLGANGRVALDTTADAIARDEALQRRSLGVGTHAH